MSFALPELDARPHAAAPPRRRTWPWLAAGLVFGVVAVRGLSGRRAGAAGAADRAREARPVPVVTAKARTGDVPVYLRGLGTATAFNTAALKSRVDGQPERRRPGGTVQVRAGELLAQIDPRPFEVQLEQAQAGRPRPRRPQGRAGHPRSRPGPVAQPDPAPAAARLPARAGRRARGSHPLGRGAGQERRAAAHLLADRGPVQRARGAAARGRRQHGPRERSGRPVRAQPGPPDRGRVSGCRRTTSARSRAGREGRAALAVLAYDRGHWRVLERQAADDRQPDRSRTGTFKFKAVFDNTDGALFPNQFVNVRLVIGTRKQPGAHPAAAVQRGSKGTYVYVVAKDDEVRCGQSRWRSPREATRARARARVARRVGSWWTGWTRSRTGERWRPRNEPIAALHPAAGRHRRC